MPEVDLKELKRPITDPDLTAGQLEKKPKTDVLNVYPDLVLSTGARIPQVQFGTYKMKKEECKKSVLSALRFVLVIIRLYLYVPVSDMGDLKDRVSEC